MLLQISPPLARAIPPDTPHSIVHSLPEWKDNIDFAVSKKELFDALEATYPRFVLHPLVREVCVAVFLVDHISHLTFV